MKKIINSIFVILCLIATIFPFAIKAEEDDIYIKGDIKCPDNVDSEKCESTLDHESVTVKETMGNFKINKTVSKTNTLGEYSIKFHVEGYATETTTIKKPAYVVIIFDTSNSISKNFKNAQNAINGFIKDLQNENIKVSLIQFASALGTNSVNANFINPTNICLPQTCGLGKSSRVELALQKAYTLLSDSAIEKDANKYVVLFGDGEYAIGKNSDINTALKGGDESHCCWNNCDNLPKWSGSFNIRDVNVVTQLSNLGTIGTINYTIKYKGKNSGNINFNNNSIERMNTIAGDSTRSYDASSGNYADVFKKIFNAIKSVQEATQKSVMYTLVDNVGQNFDPVDNLKVREFSSTSSSQDFGPFTIKIDKTTKEIWNPTNNNFTLSYSDKSYTSKVNPEVYWKAETSYIPSCSGSGNLTDFDIVGNDFYKITCEQGWNGTEGYIANLKVNDLPIDTYKFDLVNGFGFPINVNIKSNLRCTYEFFKDKYDSVLNELNNQLSKISDDKEKEIINKKIKQLELKFNNYVNTSNNITNMQNYKNDVENQQVKIHVKYKGSGNLTKDVMLVNSNVVYSNIECEDSNTKTERVLGQTIITYKRCTTSTEKNMQLPLSCLSMKNGESEDCISESNNQISGGNNFYVPITTSGGYISAEVADATYFGNDIILDGESLNEQGNSRCEFSNSINKSLFRQIDLNDPFIQNYTNKTRNIGKNWLNLRYNYNFVNIIHKTSETWKDDNYEFKYLMSKINVENIKKDTSEEGVNSYLGRNCHFREDNKYICEFVRPSSLEENEFFTNIFNNDEAK